MIKEKSVQISPIFKYIGGKTWLKENLREEVENALKKNKNIKSYSEPFVGGLGSFLSIYDILVKNNIKNIVLNDVNSRLINFYKIVNENPEKLIKKYIALEFKYSKTIPKELNIKIKNKQITKNELRELLRNAEKFFNKIRARFNAKLQTNNKLKKDELEKKYMTLELASYLLFLQNHCFNGVYRENSKGEYNTPFNWGCKIFQEKEIETKILTVNGIFKNFNIIFLSETFENLSYNKKTLYYLDPPYLNKTGNNENNYNKNIFDLSKQKKLIFIIKKTTFVYSNHKNSIIINEFNKQNIKIKLKEVVRKNKISSSAKTRSEDKIEIIVSSLQD